MSSRLGNYELGELLGRGSYARVYRSSDKAVKVVQLACLTDREKASCKEEASLCLTLQHPNIVRCFEVFHVDDQMAMAMEYCGGGTLEQRAEKGACRRARLGITYGSWPKRSST